MNKPAVFYKSTEYFQSEKKNHVITMMHKDYSIPMHSHEFIEINIVTAGTGRHSIENTDIDVKVGDIFVIPAGTMHGYEGKDSGLCVLHILLHDEFMKRYGEELSETPGYRALFDIEPLLRRSLRERCFLHADLHTLNYIKSEVAEITDAYRSGNFIYQNVIALNLVCRLCMEMHKSFNGLQKHFMKDSEYQIVKVLDHISENLSGKLSTDELAMIANMSVSTLNRNFRLLLGTTPGAYIIAKRVKKAKELISENRLGKTEIAQLCGFYDASHMDKYM